jgi:hypothetical protein
MIRRAVVILVLMTSACDGLPARARELSELTVVDSLYLDRETNLPYSGPVFRRFPNDATAVQLKGALLDGSWEGELTVYHPNGRIRYLGNFEAGKRCGPWTENADSVGVTDMYEELVSVVESMGLYPPCVSGR